MLSSLVFGVVLVFAGKDPAVVGTWGMGGATLMHISADGTGEMEGEPFQWTTDKGVLTITGSDGIAEKLGYSVKGGKLVVSMDGTPMTLDKMGGNSAPASGAPAKGGTKTATGVPAGMEGLSPEEVAYLQQLLAAQGGQQPAAQPAQPGAGASNFGKPMGGNLGGSQQPAATGGTAPQKAGKDELSQFLMRNAWCSFSYNKNSGSSSKSRVVFNADGTATMDAQGEGYSSGYGGTMASQHNTGDRVLWKVVNGKLMLNGGDSGGQWVEQPLSITRNSNGSPIVTSGGKEYMVCQ